MSLAIRPCGLLKGQHRSVNHSIRQYVDGKADRHTAAAKLSKAWAVRKGIGKASSPPRPSARRSRPFIRDNTINGTMVYTDEATGGCQTLAPSSTVLAHTLTGTSTPTRSRVLVGDQASAQGTLYHLSPKHLDRYVREFVWRLNAHDVGTAERMAESYSEWSPRPCPISTSSSRTDCRPRRTSRVHLEVLGCPVCQRHRPLLQVL